MQDSHHQLTNSTLKWCLRHAALLMVLTFTVAQWVILALFGYTPYPDSNGYLLLAHDALTYGQPYPVAEEISQLAFIWNVGAINIVALSLWLCGSIVPLLMVYGLLKGLSAALVYTLARQIMGKRLGIVALTLYVIYPANYGECTSCNSELPFTFFLLFSLFLWLKQRTLIGGGILAVANWIRPMAPVILLSVALQALWHRQWRPLARYVSGYLLVVALIGGASYMRTGYPIYQAKTGWMALLQYSVDHSPQADGYYMDAQHLDAVQKDSFWQRQTLRWIAANPTEYIRQMPRKVIDTYVSDNINFCTFLPHKSSRKYMYKELSMRTLWQSAPQLSAVQWLALLNLAYYYTLLALALHTIVRAVRHQRLHNWILPLGIVVIGTLLLMVAGHGEARFHIPLMPFIIIMAAASLKNKYAVGNITTVGRRGRNRGYLHT